MHDTVAVLGAGAMGELLAGGLVRAGWSPDELVLAARRPERAREVEEHTGASCLLDAAAAARGRRVVVVVVKPLDVPALIEQIKPVITTDQVVLSLVAGVPMRVYEDAFGAVAVVRAMPNTPALFDEAISAYCAGRHAGPEAMEAVLGVLASVGQTIPLDEHLLDAVTAVSGTGPAYLFLLAEALIEAAIREGIPRHAAERLVKQTARGAGVLLAGLPASPEQLRAQVTSPGGTTAAAVHVLEGRGFRALVEDAVRAAAERSRELGRRAEGKA
ncbi:MAG: pyrroline-5-carboxylate reductase [Actinomycetota bacterium]